MTYARVDLRKYITICVWYGCNSNCTICMLSGLKNDLPVIDFPGFKKILTKIRDEARHENLILSGAEVTTFPDLEKYLQFAASLRWFKKIQIQTNGRKLQDRRYLQGLIDSGVNEFFVSIHGLERTHDEITRTRGSFRETLAGIHSLRDFPVNVIPNTVLTKTNYFEVAPLMAALCTLPVHEIHLWNYYPMEKTDTRDLLVSLKDFLALLREVLAIVKPSGKALVLKSFPECLSLGEPGFFDSGLPVTIIPEGFWRKFRENRFGTCPNKEQCTARECWGLSAAYIQKYGDERHLLSPMV
jgi:MoaA/NifB/PqqE/SkfB family radical SAM enzyme